MARHLVLERGTRDAAEGWLEDQPGTDVAPLADDGAVDVDPLGGQILAEQPVGQPAAQPRLPPVLVLPRVRVNGLVVAAVVLDVEDLITDQAAVQPGRLGPRRAQSGSGRHYGIEGFREFSNPRGVVVRGTGDLTDAFLPPYGPLAQAIVDSIFAGGSESPGTA